MQCWYNNKYGQLFFYGNFALVLRDDRSRESRAKHLERKYETSYSLEVHENKDLFGRKHKSF
jgi:hypothetical protein